MSARPDASDQNVRQRQHRDSTASLPHSNELQHGLEPTPAWVLPSDLLTFNSPTAAAFDEPVKVLPSDLLMFRASTAAHLPAAGAFDGLHDCRAAPMSTFLWRWQEEGRLLPEATALFPHKPDSEGICKPCCRMFAVLRPDRHRCVYGDNCRYCHHPGHFKRLRCPARRGKNARPLRLESDLVPGASG